MQILLLTHLQTLLSLANMWYQSFWTPSLNMKQVLVIHILSSYLTQLTHSFESVKPWELNKRVGGKIGTIKFRTLGYDLGFSLTFEKTQSKGYQLLILDLKAYPKMSMTFEKLLVGLSRYLLHAFFLPLLSN